MAPSNAVEKLTCSICLYYFIEPVTLRCGHNFCLYCITRSWEGKREPRCPGCREPHRYRNLRPNKQLGNVVGIALEFNHSRKKQQEMSLCEEHQERLKIFCETDQRTICVICCMSARHSKHTLLPIQEAAHKYKRILEEALAPVKEDMQQLLKYKNNEEEIHSQLKKRVKHQRQKIVSEFKELHLFLEAEQQLLLSRLKEEELTILKRIEDNLVNLSKDQAALQKLINDVEEKCQQVDPDLLKDMKDPLSRCENTRFTATEPTLAVLEVSSLDACPRYNALKKVMENFSHSRQRTSAWTLKLHTPTSSCLKIANASGETPSHGAASPQSFDTTPCILGPEGFKEGRHRWDVEVQPQGGKLWAIEISWGSVRRGGGDQPATS